MCDLERGPQGVIADVLESISAYETPRWQVSREQVAANLRVWFRDHGITDEQVNEDFIRGALTMLAVAFVRANHVYGYAPVLGIVDVIRLTMELGDGRDVPSAEALDAMFAEQGD